MNGGDRSVTATGVSMYILEVPVLPVRLRGTYNCKRIQKKKKIHVMLNVISNGK